MANVPGHDVTKGFHDRAAGTVRLDCSCGWDAVTSTDDGLGVALQRLADAGLAHIVAVRNAATVCDHCGQPVHRDRAGWWVGADETSDCCADNPRGHTVDGAPR